MTFLLFLGIWFSCAVATLLFAVWRKPDWYDPANDNPYDIGAAGLAVLTTILWPGFWVFHVVDSLRSVALRAKREKLKLRDELEKDLAAARREVEDLLRSSRR